jgi:hypothetical protein
LLLLLLLSAFSFLRNDGSGSSLDSSDLSVLNASHSHHSGVNGARNAVLRIHYGIMYLQLDEQLGHNEEFERRLLLHVSL